MGKRVSSWKKGVTHALDIPADVLLDELEMRFEGSGKIMVENHKGIVEYNSKRLRFKVRNGEVKVEGDDLVLDGFAFGQLVVEGKITSIEFLS